MIFWMAAAALIGLAACGGAPGSEGTAAPLPAEDTAAPLPAEEAEVGYVQSRFYISTFKALPHDTGASLEDFAAIAALNREAGIDLIENAIMNRSDMRLAAQACEQEGVRFLVQNITPDGGFSGMGERCPEFTEETVRSVAAEMKDYAYLEGYYTWDEVRKNDLETCAALNGYFKEADPTRLAFSILLPSYGPYGWDDAWDPEKSTYAKYVKAYVETVDPDVIGFDYYPFQIHGGDGANLLNCDIWKDMGLMRREAMRTGKPFWFYFQAYDMGGGYTFTSEMRSVQMYAALAYGAKALSYYTTMEVVCDGAGNKKETFDEIRELNRRVHNLGDLLFDKSTEELYHFGIRKTNRTAYFLDDPEGSALISDAPSGSIVGVFGDGTERKYVLVVNKSYTDAMTGTLVFRSARKISRYDHVTGLTAPLADAADSVPLDVPAGDCALFIVG